ncbi:MAG: penicillin-binding protein 2 [Simkaniaceae bacterium]|nr:penicillin-binding protein 2 [Simkaniaceae bacterium]
MSVRPSKESRRILAVAVSLFFCFSLLVIQFYRLQIKEHDKWMFAANRQHQTVLYDNFKRGVIYSNTDIKFGHVEKPQPFAFDVLKYHLYADPDSIPIEHKDKITAMIAELLDLNKEQITLLNESLYKKSRSRKLLKWISCEEEAKVREWWKSFSKQARLPMNALFFVKDYKRMYPFGKLLGQVLHTVREERDDETDQAIPTGGIEMVFNSFLQGEKGKRVIIRSPRQEMEVKKIIKPVKHGNDVYLTINHYLQEICEEELEIGVKKVNAKAGMVLMMDPYTGHILAMAQYPFFYPEKYREYYNDQDLLTATSIKNISDSFEPGSTMKAVSCAIALMANEKLRQEGKEELFDPEAPRRCDDHHFLGRGPLKDVKTHRFLNMDMAIQKSSNVYVARLMQQVCERIGPHWYRDQLENVFGFGVKTGVELPYENPGFLPSPGKTYGGSKLQWSIPTPFSLAMGYNLLANAVQITRVYSIFASGGYLVYPTLIKKIVDPTTQKEIQCALINHKPPQKVLDEWICRRIIQSTKYITKKGGAGAAGEIYGYTEAGKSSTGEKLINGVYDKNCHFSTFVGMVPAEKPKFVMFVAIDEPEKKFIPGFGMTQFGGKCAAPIFRDISKKALSYLGVKPDDPYGMPPGDPRRDEHRADWIEENRRLTDLYHEWND